MGSIRRLGAPLGNAGRVRALKARLRRPFVHDPGLLPRLVGTVLVGALLSAALMPAPPAPSGASALGSAGLFPVSSPLDVTLRPVEGARVGGAEYRLRLGADLRLDGDGSAHGRFGGSHGISLTGRAAVRSLDSTLLRPDLSSGLLLPYRATAPPSAA